jgi:DNA-binding GntR family transcriptional regulator
LGIYGVNGVTEQSRIKPIEDSRKTIAAIVQDRIREAILNGLLPGGTRIDQNQLASDLNVSLVPVREALKKLEGEGFVQIVPRRGAFVSDTSITDMEDLYFTRSLLEGQAAYHGADNLTDDNLAELDRLMDNMTAALKQHDFLHFMESNRRFHFIIYDAAGSKYLSNMIIGLWELAERYRYRYMFLKDQGAAIQSEHRAILVACHAHDKKALRDAIVYHMNQTLEGIRGFVVASQQGNTPHE